MEKRIDLLRQGASVIAKAEELYQVNEGRSEGIIGNFFEDSARLLGYVHDEEPWKIKIYGDLSVSAEDADRYLILINEYAAGKPMEYILHHSDIHHDFFVDERVLIPRWETAELVREVIKNYATAENVCIDMGTGSGFIGCSTMLDHPWKHGVLVDISAGARDVAQVNIKKHHLQNKITLMEGNVCIKKDVERAIEAAMEHDPLEIVIIANLPYIPRREMSTLQRSVRDYEPHVALDGGKDGVDIIILMLDHLRELQSENNYPISWIILEIDADNIPSLSKYTHLHGLELTYPFHDEHLKDRFCIIGLA